MTSERLVPTASSPERSDNGALQLMVVVADRVETHPLSERGRWVIGRSDRADIHVDDPSISRKHAAISLSEGKLEIEDLGSANGTRLHGKKLAPNVRASIGPGQVIDLGSTMMFVQEQRSTAPAQRLSSHAYFEARLEDACTHAQGSKKSAFAVLRVRIEDAAPDLIRSALIAPLRSSDVIACYAPGEYEILLTNAVRLRADKIASHIRATLENEDAHTRIGIASYPTEGSTPDALLERARPAQERSASIAEERELVLEDPAMRDLHRLIDRLAQGTISVLLLGETGVGKEVIAERLHRRSARRERPFLRLNCAALSETLIESELFGHEKGAFTGADRAREGLLESANGGTVFLDEVGELPEATQAKLLRVLEQREVLRVGGRKPSAIDVRIISATNRDLSRLIAEQRFRQDLYYRLNGASVVVPPLRERKKEIMALAELFARAVSSGLGLREPPEIGDRAAELLLRYAWPGNVRELRNVIERAVLLAEGTSIEVEHLPFEKMSVSWMSAKSADARSDAESRGPSLDRILEALDKHAGNQTKAALELGLSRQTLSKWLDRHGVRRPRKRRS